MPINRRALRSVLQSAGKNIRRATSAAMEEPSTLHMRTSDLLDSNPQLKKEGLRSTFMMDGFPHQVIEEVGDYVTIAPVKKR